MPQEYWVEAVYRNLYDSPQRHRPYGTALYEAMRRAYNFIGETRFPRMRQFRDLGWRRVRRLLRGYLSYRRIRRARAHFRFSDLD